MTIVHSCVLALLLAGFALGQDEQIGGAKRVFAARLGPGQEIRFDGRVESEEWALASSLSPLTQVRPVEGAEASRATEVYFLQDGKTLYVGIVCHDDPAQVRARQMDRDAFVRFDDVVEMWFDTFRDHQSAYWFQITAGGSRGDALITDGGQGFNKRWDGVWDAKSRVTESGWEAEIALPFQTLAFDSSAATWGFNLRRKRVANGEEARWTAGSSSSAPRATVAVWCLSFPAPLAGTIRVRPCPLWRVPSTLRVWVAGPWGCSMYWWMPGPEVQMCPRRTSQWPE